MTIEGFWPIFIVGCFGGVMGEALNWYLKRNSPNLPKYVKGLRYWVITVIMILIGGGLATLYGLEEKSALLVAQIGLTAPVLLKSLVQIPPESEAKSFGSDPSVWDFIAGR